MSSQSTSKRSTNKSIVEEAETVYMSEGLSDILYSRENLETLEIDASSISSITLYEEEGSKLVAITVKPSVKKISTAVAMFGKKAHVQGEYLELVFRVTSVTYDETLSSISLLGLVLNT